MTDRDYKRKYLKYKHKYQQSSKQKGGKFDYDETGYLKKDPAAMRQDTVKINDIKYVAGPKKSALLYNKDTSQYIYLIGEQHFTNMKSYDCGNESGSDTTYATTFINSLIKENKDDFFDVFIELPFYSEPGKGNKYFEKTFRGMASIIGNAGYMFNICFDNRNDRVQCSKEYPNARFHTMDFRLGYTFEGRKFTALDASLEGIQLISCWMSYYDELEKKCMEFNPSFEKLSLSSLKPHILNFVKKANHIYDVIKKFKLKMQHIIENNIKSPEIKSALDYMNFIEDVGTYIGYLNDARDIEEVREDLKKLIYYLKWSLYKIEPFISILSETLVKKRYSKY